MLHTAGACHALLALHDYEGDSVIGDLSVVALNPRGWRSGTFKLQDPNPNPEQQVDTPTPRERRGGHHREHSPNLSKAPACTRLQDPQKTRHKPAGVRRSLCETDSIPERRVPGWTSDYSWSRGALVDSPKASSRIWWANQSSGNHSRWGTTEGASVKR